MRFSGFRPIIVLFAIPSIVLFIATGCIKNSSQPASLPDATAAAPATVTNGYVGSAECGTCHSTEWQRHASTHHAHTFRPMTVAALGSLAPRPTRFKDTTCLSCHSSPTQSRNAARSADRVFSGKHPIPCPVNPRTGCIGCHMPKLSLFTDNGNRIPVEMADHYIRIHR